jgi:hypothetical protein
VTAQHPVHTLQTEAQIATAQHNFNYVFLLIISTKTVTLAMFRRVLPDDGPNGPKHVGAISRDILTVSCGVFYILIKSAFVGKKGLQLSKCTVKQQLKEINLLMALNMAFSVPILAKITITRYVFVVSHLSNFIQIW